MMSLEKKYQALLSQAQQRDLADAQSMRLCFELLSLSSAIDRDCAARLAPYRLSEGRFVLLFLLDAAEGAALAPNVLAEQAGISRATVTGLLDGLEREGLIERQPDAHDRRSLRIVLTAQGRRTARKVITQHSQWIAQLLAPLSSAERGQLQHLLGKVAAAMQENTP